MHECTRHCDGIQWMKVWMHEWMDGMKEGRDGNGNEEVTNATNEKRTNIARKNEDRMEERMGV